MVIEYVGISGVGKSTLAGKKHAELIAEGIACREPREVWYKQEDWAWRNIRKAAAALPYSLCHPAWSRKFFHAARSFGLKKKNLCEMYLNGTILRLTQSTNCKADIWYLYDEGVLQLLWGVFLNPEASLDEEKIVQMMKLFECPDKVIVVEANVKTIAFRLLNRERFTKLKASQNLEVEIAQKIKLLKCIIDIVKRRCGKEIEITYCWNDEADRGGI